MIKDLRRLFLSTRVEKSLLEGQEELGGRRLGCGLIWRELTGEIVLGDDAETDWVILLRRRLEMTSVRTDVFNAITS